MLERMFQNVDTDVVLQFDDGIHIKYRWAHSDSVGKDGEVFKYQIGKKDLMFVVPTGMPKRLQRICLPWFIDPLGLFGKEFTMYRAFKDDAQAWPWATDLEETQRLSLDQISALQFDGTVVKLSKSMTGSAMDMKLIFVALALVLVVGAGYFFFVKKDKKAPVTDNVTPVVTDQMARDGFKWELVDGRWTAVQE